MVYSDIVGVPPIMETLMVPSTRFDVNHLALPVEWAVAIEPRAATG
jgi:hypothetical protein